MPDETLVNETQTETEEKPSLIERGMSAVGLGGGDSEPADDKSPAPDLVEAEAETEAEDAPTLTYAEVARANHKNSAAVNHRAKQERKHAANAGPSAAAEEPELEAATE